MKQTFKLLFVALIAGSATLTGYKLFVEKQPTPVVQNQEIPFAIPTSYTSTSTAPVNLDLTIAAEKTVNAVVHVKNKTYSSQPTNIMDYFMGRGETREMIGSGSGVIISPDGYIITNNHVIENASELSVTLNNNKTFEATLIGADPLSDIALIKISPENQLPYIPFGDSNNLKIGEWVLAVGNPFNLTSTVTAGIVSAKARDLNEYDGNTQSFIQTDAAVNRGNSGGALVNMKGDLVGINTAITSETGSYVGYSFAVPSNNAKKIIDDIMEFGNVQRGILGIQGRNLNSETAAYYDIEDTQGVYINGIERGSGAEKGGIKEGDVIKKVDEVTITKFSDLVGYISSKRPDDTVFVTISRNGTEKTIPVVLIKLETFEIPNIGLEVKNTSTAELNAYGLNYGVKVNQVLTEDLQRYDLEGVIITKVNDTKVYNIDDIKKIFQDRNYKSPIKITFMDRTGDYNSFIFR